ncbi:MAG: NfeD family protein [Bifidobacteriaceae bacterium]|jgi:membrane protein implicated in regulation of membrane protease activity|nr:NfeD family protein [Bifidobacteriaceae bacterium]
MAWLVWIGVAIALGLIEVFTLDLVFLMLSGGALASALASGLGAPWWACVLVFCLISVLMLAAVRPWALARLKAHGRAPVVTGAAAVVGQRGQALTNVSATDGRVKIEGEVWTARIEDSSAPIPAGAQVEVTAIDGATAVVTLR